MAEERTFSHITVTPHEEEEVVIHVGGPNGDASASTRSVPSAHTAASAPSASAPRQTTASGPSTVPAQGEGAAPVSPAPKQARRESQKDAYRETTLEDLERQPMSLTQKIVIAAAVILLVGFAVYYVFLM